MREDRHQLTHRLSDHGQPRAFIARKPDGVQHGLVGEIIKGFEQKGFLRVSEEHLKHRYIDLKDRPFFPGLEKCTSKRGGESRVLFSTTNGQSSSSNDWMDHLF
ncbi:nucleoside diphosphate kinase B-like [Mus caroli]|uniref:nucleoside-diphosphate kinase n=1 Tax=Mus caroli TaxID=10089 RepID=A0A6P5QQR4_MUSCR|nr:nucleoside diphosphate kinase B-like [Mus caroli]